MARTVLSLLLLSAVLVVTSHKALAEPLDVDALPRTTPVDFQTEIAPFLRLNCVACHNESSAEGGLVLESPRDMLRGGDSGPAVNPGNGDESLLLKVAAHRQETFMPPADNAVGAKNLSSQQLGLLKLWIDQGAQGTIAATRAVRWQPLPARHQPIFATAVTRDGQFGVCNRGNRLDVYHLPTSTLMTRLADPTLSSTGDNETVEIAHQDVIRALAFDLSGERLASAGFREVKIWRRSRPAVSAEWPHDAVVTSVAVSPDGQFAATGDEQGKIQIWNVATGNAAHTFAAHADAVTALAFAGDGQTCYSAALDQTVCAWNVDVGTAVGEPLTTATPVHAIALVRDGQWLLVGGADGSVRVWPTDQLRRSSGDEREPLRVIETSDAAVHTLVPVPDAADDFLSGGADGHLRRYNAATGEQTWGLAHGEPLVALAIHPEGRRAATVGGGKLKLWDLDQRQVIVELSQDPRLAARVVQEESRIAFTRSAIDLAKGDIKSYEGAARRIETTAESVKKAEEGVVKAEKTRDEKKEALEKVGEDEKKIEQAKRALADAETAVQVAMTVVERAKVVAERAVKTLADEEQAVADNEQLLAQQEAARATAAEALSNAQAPFIAVAFSRDGGRLAVGCDDGTIHFLSAATGSPVEMLIDHTTAVKSLLFTADGLLLSSSSDKRMLVAEASGRWHLERVIGGVSESQSVGDDSPLFLDRVLALDFSTDGRWLATGGGLPSRAGELKVWDVAHGRLVRDFPDAHADTVFAVRFSPNGEQLASAGADRLIRVHELAGGELVHTLAGHTAHVLGLSWRGDSQQLVSCGTDQVLKLWDVANGLPLLTMKGTTYQIGRYKGEVTAATFVGDSEQIVAASGDGTVRLHRSSSANDILTYSGAGGYQYAVAATPDGRVILAGGADGLLRQWSGKGRDPVKIYEPE